MTDDLVKRLRWLADHASFEPRMHHVAADRIEKLEASEAEWQTICDSYAAENQRFSDRIEKLEAALRRCDKLFSDIRNDWSDPRSECREGRSVIKEALEGKMTLAEMLRANGSWEADAAVKVIQVRDRRIEKLEAALRKIKDLHHGPEDDDVLWIRDDMTYKIVCDTLEGEPVSDSEARIIINKARKALEGKDD
jgi:chromosome segregation ATPase